MRNFRYSFRIRMRIFFVAIVLGFAASVASAFAADHLLTERVPVIGSFAGLLLSYNKGVAFGVEIPEPWQSMLIGGALILIGYTAWRERGTALRQTAFGLIIGGALGNIADRIPDGRVTDYFQVGTFPIFNVADSCVTIGVALLLLQTVLEWKGSKNSITN